MKRCGPALRNHALARTRRGPTLPMIPETTPIVLVDDYGALLEARRIIRAQRARPGHPPNECLSITFGGPPVYCAQDPTWPESRSNAYLYEGFDWLIEMLGPESLIIAAAIHRDESGPHGHLVATPVCDGRVNWTAVQRKSLPRVPGKLPYTVLHTVFNEDVASRYGLERGKEGSEATHEDPDWEIAAAMRHLYLRQIHERREQARAAGEPPCGIPELQHREHWELQLMANMTYPEEAGHVAEWRRIAKLPHDEHLAHKGRLQIQLATAQDKFDAAWEDLIDDLYDPVASEALRAWRRREKELEKALASDRFDDVDESIGDDLVPGYSAADWAQFISASQEKADEIQIPEERRPWIDVEEEYEELDRYARPTRRHDLQRKPS